jgi:DNA-binding GntR family transcriptional regulator
MTAREASSPPGHGFPQYQYQRQRLSDKAATHVRALILKGELKGGDFIRPEAVAETLGISATPVREGLLQLQTDGLLQVAPRRGFIISPVSAKDIRDGAQASALLGGELCARTASLVTPSDLSALQDIQTRLERAAEDGDLAVVEELNTQFHLTIYRIADAPAIYRLVETAVSNTPRPFYATVGGWPAATTRDHRAILKAFRASSNEGARQAMASDINRNGQLLARHLTNLH